MTDPYGQNPEGAAPQEPASPAGAVPPAPPVYTPPAYEAPTYPASYGATPPQPAAPQQPTAAPYGAPAQSAPYGGYPVQTTPGAAPVYGYGGGYASARRTNGLSIASLVLSIVGLLWILPFVGSVAGAIMGHISLNQIKRTGDNGRGMALAGIIVGWAGVGLFVIGMLFFIFVVFAASTTSRYS